MLAEQIPIMVCVVTLERTKVRFVNCIRSKDGEIDLQNSTEWDPTAYLSGSTDGLRLLEELERRVKLFWNRERFRAEAMIVSTPGTLKGTHEITSSSRLNIRRPISISRWAQERLNIHGSVMHDVECIAYGEYSHRADLADLRAQPSDCLVYVHADEGVGSKIVIDGRAHTGTGVAGLLGRMVIDSRGTFSEQLRAAGTIESYASRPGISTRIFEKFLADEGKRETIAIDDSIAAYRKQIQQLSSSGGARSDLPYKFIAKGIEKQDPIVGAVIDDASRAIAVALNAIMVIASPHNIILGGRIFSELPNIYSQVLERTRSLSWPNAWNSTTFLPAILGENSQILGAISKFAADPEQLQLSGSQAKDEK